MPPTSPISPVILIMPRSSGTIQPLFAPSLTSDSGIQAAAFMWMLGIEVARAIEWANWRTPMRSCLGLLREIALPEFWPRLLILLGSVPGALIPPPDSLKLPARQSLRATSSSRLKPMGCFSCWKRWRSTETLRRYGNTLRSSGGRWWLLATTPSGNFVQASGTSCHAWRAAPTYFLTTLILGIRPAKPGYAEYWVAPHPVGLEWAKGAVPTVHGEIRVDWRWEKAGGGGATNSGDPGSTFVLTLHNPAGEVAQIMLPVRNGKKPSSVTLNGKRVSGRLQATAPGDYTVRAEY